MEVAEEGALVLESGETDEEMLLPLLDDHVGEPHMLPVLPTTTPDEFALSTDSGGIGMGTPL